MRILVVGGGGREHALAWKLSQEAEVFAAPGNPGIARVGECLPIEADNDEGLANACRDRDIDLAVVGPEAPLFAGLADYLGSRGIAVFGPSQGAALLEGSKAFSKAMMAEAGVPTAEFRTFTDSQLAKDCAREVYGSGKRLVVKASGPALGKGAIVTSTLDEALDAIHRCMEVAEFGESGKTLVLEERMQGPEFSLLTICSGKDYLSLPVSQDYKRAYDDGEGPNTGGMGSYSPVAWVPPEIVRRAEQTVVAPMLELMGGKGTPFQGLLYSGLMLVDGVPKCIEYNVRFGDPETQSVMCRLGVGLADALMAAAKGDPIPPIEVLDNAVVSVVIASAGYPGPVETGLPIEESNPEPGVQVFHAGTKLVEGKLLTSGGRVAAVSAVGADLAEARERAYRSVGCFRFEGARWRSDIGNDPRVAGRRDSQ